MKSSIDLHNSPSGTRFKKKQSISNYPSPSNTTTKNFKNLLVDKSLRGNVSLHMDERQARKYTYLKKTMSKILAGVTDQTLAKKQFLEQINDTSGNDNWSNEHQIILSKILIHNFIEKINIFQGQLSQKNSIKYPVVE